MTCVFPDCEVPVTHDRPICCGRHWRELPPRIQAEVQYRLRGWKSTGDARGFAFDWFARNRKRVHL